MGLSEGNFSWLPSATISAIAGLGSAVVLKYALDGKTNTENKSPEKWLKVGVVKELVIYPIKSCQGVQVQTATVTQLGLTSGDLLRDRVFMVVDNTGSRQGQTILPKMALISVDFEGEHRVRLNAPDVPSVTFQVPHDTGNNRRSCRIDQERNLNALDCGDEVAKWLQEFLGNDTFRLVYHNLMKTQRNLKELQKKYVTTSEKDLGTFQGKATYHIIAEESIDELNKHLEKPVNAQHFRPSILITGISDPFSEIRWGVVRIGEDVILQASQPCGRCKITTVIPDSGVFHPQGEPLKTLAKLVQDFGNKETESRFKNKGMMGILMGLMDKSYSGKIIKIGDPVYVALL